MKQRYRDQVADRIFTDVFKAMLDYNGAKHGSPKFSVIEINDDWPDPNDVSKERHCRLATDIHSDSSSDIDSDGDDDKDTITDAVTNGPRDGKPSHIILCPSFFDFGIINGGLRAAPPGSSQPVTCNVYVNSENLANSDWQK